MAHNLLHNDCDLSGKFRTLLWIRSDLIFRQRGTKHPANIYAHTNMYNVIVLVLFWSKLIMNTIKMALVNHLGCTYMNKNSSYRRNYVSWNIIINVSLSHSLKSSSCIVGHCQNSSYSRRRSIKKNVISVSDCIICFIFCLTWILFCSKQFFELTVSHKCQFSRIERETHAFKVCLTLSHQDHQFSYIHRQNTL